MRTTLNVEVPDGMKIVSVMVQFASIDARLRRRPKRATGSPNSDQLPRSPRGEQLWLRYGGWERDVLGDRKLDL
jgi:hypothetical protein